MSRSNIVPGFFVIGAPRCGTTALSDYLGNHPDVCFSVPKEPHYFATDLPAMRHVTNEADYLGCYSHCSGHEYSAAGEGSVWYLYSDEAVANILRYRADAKFIIMVRNPLDLIPSLHQKAFESLDEAVPDFSTAWDLQKQRAAGSNIPKRCREPRLLQYSSVGKLGAQVQRAFQQIPERQRLVIVFDDFVEDTLQTYKTVLDFLGVRYDGRVGFPRINEHKRVRNRSLLELAWYPPVGLLRLAERFKRMLHIEKLGVLPRLRDALVVAERRLPLSEEMRNAMLEEFAADIDLLSGLLGRDLSHWKRAR